MDDGHSEWHHWTDNLPTWRPAAPAGGGEVSDESGSFLLWLRARSSCESIHHAWGALAWAHVPSGIHPDGGGRRWGCPHLQRVDAGTGLGGEGFDRAQPDPRGDRASIRVLPLLLSRPQG